MITCFTKANNSLYKRLRTSASIPSFGEMCPNESLTPYWIILQASEQVFEGGGGGLKPSPAPPPMLYGKVGCFVFGVNKQPNIFDFSG